MTSLERAGHFLSVVLHPAVTMFVTAFLLSSYARENFALALVDMGILVAGILPGLIYIFVKSRRGDFTHYQLLLKEERRTVFPILLAGLIGSLAFYAIIHAPASLVRGMLIGIIGGVGAAIISRFWKVSMHAAVAMGCAALFVPISWPTMLAIMALGIVAGTARLLVRHHTPAQVLGGWLYGFGVTLLLLRMLPSLPL